MEPLQVLKELQQLCCSNVDGSRQQMAVAHGAELMEESARYEALGGDPAAEAQAAGRIHRLGQVNDVLIKRFCAPSPQRCPPSPARVGLAPHRKLRRVRRVFAVAHAPRRAGALLSHSRPHARRAGFRKSIEARIVEMHAAIKQGTVTVSGGTISAAGVLTIAR